VSAVLKGVRVLDLSRVLAGPWATQLLGDFGADIVKVERPGSGDDTRQWGPPWLGGEQGESAYFLSTNRNKRSVTIDLKNPQGVRIVREMAAKADVIVENFKPGTMQRFGLDEATLRDTNRGLIFCSISAFGQHGNRSSEPGYDAMIQASGGLMSITGAAETGGGEPQKVGVAIADIMAGMYAATAILAALRHRDQSGQGQYIDVPLYDSQVAWLANQNMNYLVGGKVPERRGTAHPNIVPYQVFPTRDGHLMLAVGNDEQFSRCVEVLELENLAADTRFSRNAARVENRDELVALLEAAFLSDDTNRWHEALSAASVPCGPINDIKQVFDSEYAREQSLVRTLSHPLDEALPTVINPIRFAATPVQYDKAPPMLGQHTDEILIEWLGYSAQAIGNLRDSGAI
jgi:crotonobetainyl-CoA:carnitine CoA-transferase CaiB-like acyl-CoA transferase